jgi:hypothetical protein
MRLDPDAVKILMGSSFVAQPCVVEEQSPTTPDLFQCYDSLLAIENGHDMLLQAAFTSIVIAPVNNNGDPPTDCVLQGTLIWPESPAGLHSRFIHEFFGPLANGRSSEVLIFSNLLTATQQFTRDGSARGTVLLGLIQDARPTPAAGIEEATAATPLSVINSVGVVSPFSTPLLVGHLVSGGLDAPTAVSRATTVRTILEAAGDNPASTANIRFTLGEMASNPTPDIAAIRTFITKQRSGG